MYTYQYRDQNKMYGQEKIQPLISQFVYIRHAFLLLNVPKSYRIYKIKIKIKNSDGKNSCVIDHPYP